MKPYQYIRILVLAFAVLSFSACYNDDNMLSGNGENVSVAFRPTLGDKFSTRAIGNAASIDQLVVAVYEGNQTLSKVFSCSKDWSVAQTNGITLTLIEGRSYKILFWAQDKENTAHRLPQWRVWKDGRNGWLLWNIRNHSGFAKKR